MHAYLYSCHSCYFESARQGEGLAGRMSTYTHAHLSAGRHTHTRAHKRTLKNKQSTRAHTRARTHTQACVHAKPLRTLAWVLQRFRQRLVGGALGQGCHLQLVLQGLDVMHRALHIPAVPAAPPHVRAHSTTNGDHGHAGGAGSGRHQGAGAHSKPPAKNWVRRSEAERGQKGLVGGSRAGLERGKRLVMGSHSSRQKAPVCMGGNRTCPTWPQEQAMLPGAAAGRTQFRYALQAWGATLISQPVSSWPAQALRALRIGYKPQHASNRGHCKALHSCSFLSEPVKSLTCECLRRAHSEHASCPRAAACRRHSLGALAQEGLHAVAVRAHHLLHHAQQLPTHARHQILPLLRIGAFWHTYASK